MDMQNVELITRLVMESLNKQEEKSGKGYMVPIGVSARHIHMSPADAQAAGVHDGDFVSVKADNERGTIFNHVKIRVDESFTLEMHIDTDEANASQIATGMTVSIVK